MSEQSFERQLVKRIGMTGALTYASAHLENLEVWEAGYRNRVSAEEMDRWLDDPEPNPDRDRAFKLARLLLGVEVPDE